MTISTTEQRRWQAVQQRDEAADGRFVFAVVTTGVFCRPSCRSRRARRENVRFYDDASAAIAAGYRPCKRCQPDRQPPSQQRTARIADACRLLAASETPLTLAEIAAQMAMSPGHFHRQFRAATGLTPRAWQQAQRAERLRTSLASGESVTRALFDAGFQTGSNYYYHADAALGMTAGQYRSGAAQVAVCYTIAPCTLGLCLVARSERGICAILLGDDDNALHAELLSLFPHAMADDGSGEFDRQVAQVIAVIDAPQRTCTLPLDIRGTAFQQQVWQALRSIPAGQTVSYRELAQRIGRPTAVRAVASACAANRLALVIPCHRVISSSGATGNYRWGPERKAVLLAREAQGTANTAQEDTD